MAYAKKRRKVKKTTARSSATKSKRRVRPAKPRKKSAASRRPGPTPRPGGKRP